MPGTGGNRPRSRAGARVWRAGSLLPAHPDAERHGKFAGATYCSFEDLLAQSDYVSIHLPSNKSTEALIDADALARMKDERI